MGILIVTLCLAALCDDSSEEAALTANCGRCFVGIKSENYNYFPLIVCYFSCVSVCGNYTVCAKRWFDNCSIHYWFLSLILPSLCDIHTSHTHSMTAVGGPSQYLSIQNSDTHAQRAFIAYVVRLGAFCVVWENNFAHGSAAKLNVRKTVVYFMHQLLSAHWLRNEHKSPIGRLNNCTNGATIAF